MILSDYRTNGPSNYRVIAMVRENNYEKKTRKCKCRLLLFDKTRVNRMKNESSWPWSYGSLTRNYRCNQCLSPLNIYNVVSSNPVQARRTRYNIIYKVCHWLAAGPWFSPGSLVSSTNETVPHDITEILLKVALNTITLTVIRMKKIVYSGSCSYFIYIYI